MQPANTGICCDTVHIQLSLMTRKHFFKMFLKFLYQEFFFSLLVTSSMSSINMPIYILFSRKQMSFQILNNALNTCFYSFISCIHLSRQSLISWTQLVFGISSHEIKKNKSNCWTAIETYVTWQTIKSHYFHLNVRKTISIQT